MPGDPWFDIRLNQIQRSEIFVHHGYGTLGKRFGCFAVFIGPGDDFIVHIGDVTHVLNVVVEVAQITHQHIKTKISTGMAHVAEVIHGYATNIESHLPFYQRLKTLFLTGFGVKQLQHILISS